MKSKIILINGTSCTGKSSVSKLLNSHYGDSFIYLTWDSFLERINAKETITDADKKDLVSVFIREVSAQAKAGDNLILDIVCVPSSTFERLVQAFKEFDLYKIRMRASVEELERRELARPDRKDGQAKTQHIQMFYKYTHPEYDLEIDSTDLSPQEITKHILRELENFSSLKSKKTRQKDLKI